MTAFQADFALADAGKAPARRFEAEARWRTGSPAAMANGKRGTRRAAPAKRNNRRRPGVPPGAAAVGQRSPMSPQLAGVGAITVSRALREPERVSDDLRGQIAAAIKTLGYIPDPNARALASARAEVVGVLVPSLTNSVFADVVRGIYDGLTDTSLQIQIGNTHYSGIEEERLLQSVSRPAAGGADRRPASTRPAARRLLESAGCPVVQIMETGPEPIDMMVGFSHFDGGRAATEHLIETGYRRIGFVGARMDPRSQRRLAGYRAATGGGRPVRPAAGHHHAGPVQRLARPRAAARCAGKAPTLDAVFCNNDDLALGVLFECHRAALRCHRPIGIAGFNDLDMMQAAYPSITSVRTHRYDIGSRAAAMARAESPARRSAQRWSISASSCGAGKHSHQPQ